MIEGTAEAITTTLTAIAEEAAEKAAAETAAPAAQQSRSLITYIQQHQSAVAAVATAKEYQVCPSRASARGTISTHTTNVIDFASTTDWKSHSSTSLSSPHTALAEKLWTFGPRGACFLSPMPIEIRKLKFAMAPDSSASHFNWTKPLPLAFLKDAPPFRSFMAFG
mmetsp:Transcript_135946/g.271213  ORF Transcript_135946/g.271213 Transcript_135946/m.271213 type:complete len:166 (+) Transcript_135946:285-782(+)